MTDFELTFHIRELPTQLIDELLDELDCIAGTDHGGQDFVTLTAAGPSCVQAAKDAMMRLIELGLRVERMQEDLASRAEIAERLGVTRQAVGNWIRGERGDGFPVPFNEVGGGVWLWGDVARWAIAKGRYDADGIQWPTRKDHDLIGGWIVTKCENPFTVMERLTTSSVPTSSVLGARLASVTTVSGSVVRREAGKSPESQWFLGERQWVLHGLHVKDAAENVWTTA